MYFSKPYIKTLHKSLLEYLLSKEEIFIYPIEFTREESSNNDNLRIKDFKKVKVVEREVRKIDLNYLENNIQEIYDNKYYLITKTSDDSKV
jgi:hypothetical protein